MEEGLTVMTIWRAVGERLHLSTKTVFIAQRPNALNVTGVRQCLEDSLQLQVQKEFGLAELETSGAQLE